MIQGETIMLQLRIFGRKDKYGNELVEYEQPQRVHNVLYGRRSQRDEAEAGRPYEYSETATFCFPKGFNADLRGAIITRRFGDSYEVIGKPTHYTAENIPPLVPWDIKAEAVARNG